MGIPLRVLLIEDSEKDATLVLHELWCGGYEPTSERVQTAVDLAAALDRQEWDIALSDYGMPQFDGMSALKMVRKRRASLPFILISGTIGEETAVAAMKAGANDYLMKDRLSRLSLAVQKELEDAWNRLATEQAMLLVDNERKRMEHVRAHFETIVRCSNDAIISKTNDGIILSWNDAAERIFGYTAQEVIGRSIKILVPPSQLDEEAQILDRMARGENVASFETVLTRKDSTPVDISESISPIKENGGRTVGAVKIARDITEQKHIEMVLLENQRELERNNRRLEELYETAQRFVDNVSHEFRTPLTVINGYSEVIRDGIAGPITAQQNEFIELILDRSRDLAQMVDDLLDSSKLRAGTLRVNRRPHRAEEILSDVHPMIVAKAATNKIEVVEEIDANLPDVFIDAEKVGRIIVNLAVNAIKFSPEGSRITIWARRATDDLLEIGITDQGPGISPEDLRLIFDRFKQVGNAQNETAKGFGLGLNIARELAAINLGEIHVSSTVGHGSTFSFTIPFNVTATVLQRYLLYLDKIATVGEAICLFRVATVSAGEFTEEMRGLLASFLRPAELLLDGPVPSSLLLIGCTGNADKWFQRLRESAATRLNGLIEIEHIASWCYPAEKVLAEMGILETLQVEASHV